MLNAETDCWMLPHKPALYLDQMGPESQKTFYLETFGCQMNVHDSEKVIGTLI